MSESLATAPQTQPGVSTPRFSALDWTLIVIVLGIALALRLTHTDKVLSFDEIWHLATTQGYGSPTANYELNVIHRDVPHMTSLDHAAPVWAIWQDMRGVLHPPGFLIALRLWREVFGDSDWAAHLFSITWSLVGIVFTILTGRIAMNRWAAALCGLAIACGQTQCYFAQEVRPYGMLIGLGSICLWIMTRCELYGPTRGRVLWLAFLSLLLLLTHYFAFGAAVAIGLFCVFRCKPHRTAFLIAIAACAAFYMVAWVPFALRQIRDFGVGDVLIKLPHRDPIYTTFMLAGAPFRLFAERDYMVEFMPVFSGVLFILPWEISRRFRALVPWSLWLCCTLGAIFALDMARTTRHAAYVRYLAIATPAVPLLFVGTVWPIRRWLAYAIGATLSFGGFIYLISSNVVLVDAQPYPLIPKVLSQRIAPGEPLLSFEDRPESMWRAPVVLMVAAHDPNIFPRTMAIIDRPMPEAMVKELGTPTAWLIVNLDTAAEAVVPGCRVIETFYGDENLMVHHIALDGATTRPSETTTRPSDTASQSALPSLQGGVRSGPEAASRPATDGR